MTTQVSVEQVRWWLDEDAVQDVTSHAGEETEFDLEVTLSRLPIHLIKEEAAGPVRVVGRSAFDTERARRLVREDESLPPDSPSPSLALTRPAGASAAARTS